MATSTSTITKRLALSGALAAILSTAAVSQENFGLHTPAPSGEIDQITWALTNVEAESLDWIYAWDYASQNTILANLCEGLRRYNPEGEIEFALASDLKTPDPLTYVYTLREGAVFTDGSPVTAEDVAFSLNRHMIAEPASYWGLFYMNVAEITATGPMEVTVKLSQPDSLFDVMMSTPAGYVAKRAYVEDAGASYGTAGGGVMCTGPYKIETWTPGYDITLSKNPDYWDPDLIAKTEMIRFVSIIDASGLAAALQTGEVDGAWSPAPTIRKTLENASNGTLYMNAGTESVTMQPADLTGSLSDVRVRQALQSVIDYEGILHGILGGAGSVPTTMTTQSLWGAYADKYAEYAATVPPLKQDLEKARALMAEVGPLTDPVVVAVSSEDTQVISAVSAIQHAAVSVGIPFEILKLTPQDFLNFFYDPVAREGVDLFANMVTSDAPDPLELFSQIVPGAPYNFSNFDDPGFTENTLAALKEMDPVKRAELSLAAEKSLTEATYYFPLYSLYSRVFLGERITGVPVSTLVQLYYPWAATIGAR